MPIDKDKKERAVLIINTALFFLGGVDNYNQGNITLFLILIATGLSNFSLLFLTKEKDKSRLNLFVFFLNSMIAFLVAREYYLDGTNYIHYAWLAAGMVYLVAAVFIFRRNKIKQA